MLVHHAEAPVDLSILIILTIPTIESLTNTVIVVEEGDVIVKSEMVFIDFIDESSQVDEEETFNLIHRIIKDHRAPRRMVISLQDANSYGRCRRRYLLRRANESFQ